MFVESESLFARSSCHREDTLNIRGMFYFPNSLFVNSLLLIFMLVVVVGAAGAAIRSKRIENSDRKVIS